MEVSTSFGVSETDLAADPAEVAGQQEVNSAASETSTNDLGFGDNVDSAALDAAFAQLAQPQEEKKPEGEEDPEDVSAAEEKGKKPLSSYQKRVQGLIAEREAIKGQALEMQRSYAVQMAQFKAEAEAARREAQEAKDSFLKRQMEIFERQAAQQEDAKLSDVERARRKFVAELKQELSPDVGSKSELEATRKELAEVKNWITQARAQAEQAQRVQNYERQINGSLDTVVFTGFDAADVTELKDEAGEMLAAYTGAFGLSAQEAAAKFKAFQTKFARALYKSISKQQGGQKVAQSRAMPQALPAGRSGAAVAPNKAPTLEQVRKAGYPDLIKYYRALASGNARPVT